MQRIITGIILFLVVCGVLFYLPEKYFMALVALGCLAGLYEVAMMYKFNLINRLALFAVFIVISYMLCFTSYDANPGAKIAILILWVVIIPLILIVKFSKLNQLMVAILALAVFSLAFYSIVMLHILFGPLQLLLLMMIAWISDTFAYFVGKRYGVHKFAPQISPGKSVQGAVAALVSVFVYLLILKHFNLSMFVYNTERLILFALVLTTAGIVGDLFESWLKRVAGVKDSGAILPGHGGVFDRIDSLLAIVTIAYLMISGFN